MARRSEARIRERIEKLQDNSNYLRNGDFYYTDLDAEKAREEQASRNDVRIETLQWVLKEKEISE